MKIEVLLFGVAREITGHHSLKLNFTSPATVENLLSVLKDNYPELRKLSSLLIAVNQSYAGPDTLIKSDDEIAVIPPVSGG